MDKVNATIILNIELKDTEFINSLTIIARELSLSLDEIVLYALEKLIYDIAYVRNLRK